ncbi:MAG: histidine phosphatase family protein [Patescibacteria group bacterium]|nr:histidine phosphatase family protein [Patescibacteria group bacterium]
MNLHPKNTFHIVRHGKAKNNELGIESCKLETQKAYGLIPKGREIVSQESQKYTDFDLIFSSPFRRTQETAAFFAETSNCEIILDDRLVDLDLGDLDLKSYETSKSVTKQHPDPDYIYPNGGSFNQSLHRLTDFVTDINSKYEDKKILIVSHGFPCEALLDWANDIPLRNWEKCMEKGKVFPLKTQPYEKS